MSTLPSLSMSDYSIGSIYQLYAMRVRRRKDKGMNGGGAKNRIGSITGDVMNEFEDN